MAKTASVENIKRNIYFKFENELFYIGELTNRITKLELIFTPSTLYATGGKLKKEIMIDHFTYHFSGRAHLKDNISQYDIFNTHFANGKNFGDLQFVIFFRFIVEDILSLLKHTTLKKNPVIFDAVKQYNQGIEVSLYDIMYLINKGMAYDKSNDEIDPIQFKTYVFGEIGTAHEKSVLVIMHVEEKNERSIPDNKKVALTQFFGASAQFK